MLHQTPIKWRRNLKFDLLLTTPFSLTGFHCASPLPRNITNVPLSPSETMKPTSRQSSLEKKQAGYRKYEYTPLGGTNSIRLLKLHSLPSPDSNWPIRCSLFHTSFAEAPPYIALSYVWANEAALSSYPSIKNMCPSLPISDMLCNVFGPSLESRIW